MSKQLTPYDWYLKLGDTPAKRQRAYRRMCDAYLRRHGLLPKPGLCSGYYIGSPAWREKRLLQQREARRRASTAARRGHRDRLEVADTS